MHINDLSTENKGTIEPPLAQAIDHLSQSIDTLQGNLDTLKSRLAPVLNNQPMPMPTDPGMHDDSPESDDYVSGVVRTLRDHKEWIQRLTNDVNNVLYH